MVYQQDMTSVKHSKSLRNVLRKPPYIDLALERDKDVGRSILRLDIFMKRERKKTSKK
jgi:hypothetical protein